MICDVWRIGEGEAVGLLNKGGRDVGWKECDDGVLVDY